MSTRTRRPCPRALSILALLAGFLLPGIPARPLRAQSPAQPPATASVAGAACTKSGQPDQLAPITDRFGPAVPLLLSYSGGISLGAYEAGVNWGLIEFAHLLRTDSTFRAQHCLPVLRLASLTGASAGNINALLGAIQYCDDAPIRAADHSLFWKAWVHTGWSELFPERDEERLPFETGVFDRRHFREYVERTVTDTLNAPVHDRSCEVPVGLVLTRLIPGALGLDASVRVATQRYTALFTVKSRGSRLVFESASARLLGHPGLGQQVILQPGATGIIEPASVYSAIEASAAYPLAFAPVTIASAESECVWQKPANKTCPIGPAASFVDGGVFDNIPMGLALAMYRLSTPVRVDSVTPRLVYVNPDALRGRWAAAVRQRLEAAGEPHADGLSAVLYLGRGFIPSARQYELQTLARTLHGDVSAGQAREALIFATDRGHPIIGEHLGAFAAFLGRPFREFDFWAGVADATHFIAANILCTPSRIAATALPSSDIDACVWDGERDLLAKHFDVGPVGHEIIVDILRREDAGLSADRYDVRGDELARVLRAIEHATAVRMERTSAPVCTGDFIDQTMCQDEFDMVLDSLRGDAEPGSRSVYAIAADWSRDQACRARVGSEARSRCLAEWTFVDLLSDSHGTIQHLIDNLLRRERAVEGRADGHEHHPFALKTGEFLLRSLDQNARRGVDWDPSSIPPRLGPRGFLLHALPYYVGGTAGSPGFQLGWQPTYHWTTPGWAALVVPIEVDRFHEDYTYFSPYRWSTAISPSLAWKTGNPLVGQIEAGARFQSAPGTVLVDYAPTPEVAILALANKLRLSAYQIPRERFAERSFRWILSISASDVNGLLYWVTP